MVNFSNSLLCALLATAASAELRHDKRHHHHRRKAPCTTDTSALAAATAPYPIGNGTAPVGATGTGAATSLTTTISATSTLFSTITVVPVPASSGAGAVPSGGSGVNQSGGAPGGSSPSSAAGSNGGSPGSGAGAGGQCGPATVTVTAQNTVTVTAGTGGAAPSSGAAAGASSAAASSPAAVSPPAASPSSASAAAAPSSPAAASPSPIASPSSASVAAAATSSQAAKVGSAPSSAPASASPSATPSASPSSSSAAASATGASSGGKCGMGYTGSGQVGSGTPLGSSVISWAYNWYYASSGLSGDIEYVPSLQKPEWTQSLSAAVASATGVQYILSLNEPDETTGNGGSATSPSDAVDVYTSTLNALGGQYKIASPAVTSDNSSSGAAGFASGLQWLQQFHDACNGACKVDFIPLHWYGNAAQSASDQASAFLQYVDDATSFVQALYPGAEIWFPEISALPTADQDAELNSQFVQAVVPSLESNGAVTRYAYYMAEFLESGDSLNAAGQSLISAAGGSS